MLYVIAPFVVTLTLIGMYYSGVSWLRALVSPDVNREFGLLENLQVILLLVLFSIPLRGLARTRDRRLRLTLFLLAGACLFMVLEEVDYGLHVVDLARGVTDPEEGVRNLHNLGDSTRWLKRAGDLVMILLFIVAPLALRRSRSPWVRYLLPDPYVLGTAIVGVGLSRFAHYLQDTTLQTGSISKNVSEFRELVTYYAFALYFHRVLLCRTSPLEADAPRTRTQGESVSDNALSGARALAASSDSKQANQ
jgi:hypothetical protein